jgi:hypothetical protein
MRFLIAVCIAFVLSGPAYADTGYVPDLKTIAMIESKIRIPHEPGMKRVPLAQWVRYYTGSMMAGRKMIAGTYVVTGAKPGIYIVAPNRMPARATGGCEVVHVLYDVAASLPSVYCNGADFR